MRSVRNYETFDSSLFGTAALTTFGPSYQWFMRCAPPATGCAAGSVHLRRDHFGSAGAGRLTQVLGVEQMPIGHSRVLEAGVARGRRPFELLPANARAGKKAKSKTRRGRLTCWPRGLIRASLMRPVAVHELRTLTRPTGKQFLSEMSAHTQRIDKVL